MLIGRSFFFFFLIMRRPAISTRRYTLFPYTTLFRSVGARAEDRGRAGRRELRRVEPPHADRAVGELQRGDTELGPPVLHLVHQAAGLPARPPVRRPRGGELEPLCRQAIDHDLLLEE